MFHELEATLFPSFHVQTLFDHSLGKVLDISCVYPPTFFWPSTVFPGEDGKKDGPQVGHSTKKPDSPGTSSSFRCETRVQTPLPPFIPHQVAFWGVTVPHKPNKRDGVLGSRNAPDTSYTCCPDVQRCLWGLPCLHTASLREPVFPAAPRT